MALLSDALDPWIATLLALFLPPVLTYISSRRRRTPKHPQQKLTTPLRRPLTIVVALHTLYTAYTLLFARPPNLFTSLGLPLSAPQSRIHAALLVKLNETTLPPDFDALLARLASFEVRTVLVRFGQQTVQTCTYCKGLPDYALHFLPSLLLSYTARALILGLVTVSGSLRERWRGSGVAVLVVAALADAYWAYTVPIAIPRPNTRDAPLTMWHDMLFTARHALFLFLPLALHLAPPTARPPPARLTAQTLDAALARTHLLRYASAAVHRDAVLAARARVFWEREKGAGEEMRADDGVRAAALAAGIGFDEAEAAVEGDGWVGALKLSGVGPGSSPPRKEGPLRALARAAVESLMGLFQAP
ncbi:hypothetical protein BV25DRAFT_1825125 [Artomyces pyxidatus]|uniref:Uncharacterized protein n=1 Tax=Artomyces pyxidatus TaxID=48021 RepID=A0ACB8T1B4_9AGAM|nr:hypothetical protein BV25DRAFT_1825125 [Artomyces pyxidatus]